MISVPTKIKAMEELKNDLEILKNSMPINFTLLNLQKLKMHFSEYKKLISSLHDNYKSVKDHCEHYFDFLAARIDTIENNNSFQEAIDRIKSQIDMVLATMQTRIA